MGPSKIYGFLTAKIGYRLIFCFLTMLMLTAAPFGLSDAKVWKRHRIEVIGMILALPAAVAACFVELAPFYRLAKSRYGKDRKKVREDFFRQGLFGEGSVDELRDAYLRELRESDSPDEEALRRVEPAEWRHRRESVRLKHQLEDMGFPDGRPIHDQVLEILKTQGVRIASRFVSGLGEYAVLLARLKRAPWSNELDYDKDVWPFFDRFDMVALRSLVEEVETEAALRIVGARVGIGGDLETMVDPVEGGKRESLFLRKGITSERYLRLYPLIVQYDSLFSENAPEAIEELRENAYRCARSDVPEAEFNRACVAFKKALSKLVS